MALDGLFISKLRAELEINLSGSRVEKIYQPSKDELIFVMRYPGGQRRLFISARADCPRIHFMTRNIENPAKPPMFCMLLRKLLGGARFNGVEQIGLDRILFLKFLSKNEMGDDVELILAVEIMGKYSNIILVNENGKIVDSIKRVNEYKSSVREVLPGNTYHLPPMQNKLNITTSSLNDIYERVTSFGSSMLSSALLKSLEGVSKLFCNELVFDFFGADEVVSEISQPDKLISSLAVYKNKILSDKIQPVILMDKNRPKEFYFMPIKQYGSLLSQREFNSLSEMLESFYFERDRLFRTKQRAHLLSKTISTAIEHTSRRINIQSQELARTENAEEYKKYGELIAANAYSLQKGSSEYEVFDYYSGENVSIKVDCSLTPMENSQRYYKKYKKSLTAKVKLKEEIEKGRQDLEYLESMDDLLARSTTFEEMKALKDELVSQGFLNTDNKTGKREKPKKLSPAEYRTTKGFTVLVGRNNTANDYLTLSYADKNDIWFHTKLIHGSHSILVTSGKEPDRESILEAAQIAAYHSKGRMSSSVPVDFTAVKNVRKPSGAKPGMVIYDNYNTVYVTPREDEVERLKV